MTKQEILEYFKDINHAYNESTRFDDLSHMLDELMQSNSDGDCISRQAVLDKIKEICFSKEQKWVDFRVSQGSNGQRNLIINFIEDLPSIQPKDIYNKGWKDGAEATAYHVELCEKENPTIPMSVIEDIKAEIVNTVCEESNHCDGDLGFLKWCAGLKYSLKIIDKHIEDIGGK